ncbi:hypothetical protein AA12717_0468 [Gluconacetobacter sacchari DSM 12717]|uniref:Uncharacterized protein n=1 Tax=Gluconacetobacter sacchari DSM 12717 TaxID=1307940 RepID=A0ABQ0P2U2_9PROT|nr:hypothetical protein AA12717_0468 [Gluconacetobacter sacchari DSM 12717]
MGQLDDFKRDTVRAGRLVWFWTRTSLVDIGQFDAFVCHLLNGGGEASDLDAIVPIGWCDVKGQQMAERVHGPICSFEPFVERKVRLLWMAAVGSALRPEAMRSTARRSDASASKQPASSQRRDC